ncbi:MAG: Mur ligase family protein [Patescibacteria group bacterium]|jgi:UDP-N-acetylmuramoyl-L-alanyl-D-glutamate--2,6-diaminopimelate ligase
MGLKSFLRALAPQPLMRAYYWCIAVLVNVFFWFPGRQLRVFAVTGTNGKTTTSLLLYRILTAARRRTGLMTTVRFSDGKRFWRNDTKMGTQSPLRLQSLLRRMVRNRATDAVLETTSIGLDQQRAWGVPVDTAVLTNFTLDHLEYHGTKEAYRLAKERLFALPHRVSVVNGEDPSQHHFLKYPAVRKLKFAIDKEADVVARGIRERMDGTQFRLEVGQESVEIHLRLIGRFNVENALAAAAAAVGANISLDAIKEGLESLEVSPGRMELVDCGQPFGVMIDYAHTPDGLKKVFDAVRPLVKGRLIAVGGATGNRYPEKRPIMGALMGQYADVVIVTDEDPYDEDPAAIMAEVVRGVKRGGGRKKQFEHGENFFTVLDRAEAIEAAIRLAKPNDLVLITGKGDEGVMVVAGGRHVPHSDRAVVQSALKRR